MFTYIEISDKNAVTYRGYIDYEFTKDSLSITLVRGMRALHRTIIHFKDITNLQFVNFYGAPAVSFIYDSKKYTFINTGYGESRYLLKHMARIVRA